MIRVPTAQLALWMHTHGAGHCDVVVRAAHALSRKVADSEAACRLTGAVGSRTVKRLGGNRTWAEPTPIAAQRAR
jgi:hypothetical protein